jgi:hypothetical protein
MRPLCLMDAVVGDRSSPIVLVVALIVVTLISAAAWQTVDLCGPALGMRRRKTRRRR